MFVHNKVLYANAFSDDHVGRDDAVLYDRAGLDNAASSNDGIFNSSLDETAVGYNRRSHLTAFKILCRAGIVRTGVDRPVRVEEAGSIF